MHYERARLADGSIGPTTFDIVTLCLECEEPTGTTRRFCRRCTKEIPKDVRKAKYKNSHYETNKPAYTARNKARVVSPEESRFYNLKYNYGLTYEQFQDLKDSQNNCCGVCDKPEHLTVTGRLHIDHDHVTGEVRGLLCMGCNTGIGHLKDDIDLLRKAIEYLERTKTDETNGIVRDNLVHLPD